MPKTGWIDRHGSHQRLSKVMEVPNFSVPVPCGTSDPKPGESASGTTHAVQAACCGCGSASRPDGSYRSPSSLRCPASTPKTDPEEQSHTVALLGFVAGTSNHPGGVPGGYSDTNAPPRDSRSSPRRRCDVFLFVLSESSTRRETCPLEVGCAAALGSPLCRSRLMMWTHGSRLIPAMRIS